MKSILQVRDLRRSFYGVKVLTGVDLDVIEGAITGLIGPNGAGKSTFFNCISGLYMPDSGSVMFDGVNITRARSQDRVAAGLVRTFQLARGFPKLTVFQHFMLYGQNHPGEGLLASLTGSAAGRRHEEQLAEEALSIARRLRLTHVIDNPVTALSGGQKKLVEIGRALMAKPRLILLDEPMAGVNPTLTAEIAEHLKALNAEGVTICLIEHDMKLIGSLCDPVIVMAEGRKLTEGSFTEVVSDERVQEAYLGGRH
ncbi:MULTISPECIES: ABC transporter ATP-binding protein [Rhizobium/Agrobacterium group]|uniref:ABC transporter ATP-binding protein n=2 Tax=Neorhizobium TaxID=1525371 RepID=A0ABV0MAC7_9HYPH|nr:MULTISPECIES: ABC transporter ATP-binding protein [Rhizobium/Agrobacterium group]KGD94047.1 branched-chain amino acid ABC transporter ATPase [Rhizobium sp. YS-1r]MCC2613872.1 ABC transporter ATP-binding protein [Neorhizobium petrolearium]WGI71395.1 ABC transporter ATP-binding protein [Neorhizobium petrolearium]